ncbi:MAG: Short-chain alcohol dehydrogenase [Candidatus Jorgensenbacteria bacterium GW2011_GWA1_48_13]|uniref:Short-chain alcohol dehydrogenase n=2 Tax=Candidatus Joergenseniibacteriota TaxID=1752739 RepID=A0A0G1YJL8_9BACT|nr:MAG: Short-chain alcohol dehydrogenase [Candidatus Jorgensenbacteria bacterium GW2011_GWA1_48_13]KKU98917.1 MAG: Short-chain alcohol dehydrogenase [Candidatus Jorgensenbacteria bacterium GW2011_GWC1_48_8]KKW15147.1 MAG: Short-chain alcohol dehydrogenase [Candidatus Jorgensenbacteria bacterium GW2011_GWB1_50_10]
MVIKDKIVVITGASGGFGKALAAAFAKEGAKLILSSRSGTELDNAGRELNAAVFTADVTDENEVVKLANFAVQKFGKIDVWVNNAGIWVPHAPAEEMDLKRVHDMVEVNLFGTIHGSRVALIQMKKQHSGTIVNILSTSALQGRAGSSGYVASKYAAVGFTKSLRLEAQPEKIKILAVYPGGMRTHLFDEKMPEDYDKYMDPGSVAKTLIENLKKDNPEEELIIRRK